MVSAARAVQEHEETLSELELQLKDLGTLEGEKTAALDLRRQQLNGVLTALQRLAFRPSEALIAQPTSPADTVRSAILLRDVLPKIQESATDAEDRTGLRWPRCGPMSPARRSRFPPPRQARRRTQRLAALYDRKEQLHQETEEQRRDTDRRYAGDGRRSRRPAGSAGAHRAGEEAPEQEAAERAAAEKAAREAERIAAKAAHDAEIAAAKAARDAAVAAAKAAKEQHDAEIAAARQAKQAEDQAARAAKEAQAKADKAAREARRRPPRPVRHGHGRRARARPFSQAQGDMPFPARGKIVFRFGQADDLRIAVAGHLHRDAHRRPGRCSL